MIKNENNEELLCIASFLNNYWYDPLPVFIGNYYLQNLRKHSEIILSHLNKNIKKSLSLLNKESNSINTRSVNSRHICQLIGELWQYRWRKLWIQPLTLIESYCRERETLFCQLGIFINEFGKKTCSKVIKLLKFFIREHMQLKLFICFFDSRRIILNSQHNVVASSFSLNCPFKASVYFWIFRLWRFLVMFVWWQSVH